MLISLGKLIDLTGQRFGRLVVLERLNNKFKNVVWRCQCDCGNIVSVIGSYLRTGKTKSCGCFNRDRESKWIYAHGMCNTRLYHIWSSMLIRCENPKHKYYENYGGQGITVCQEWHKFKPFMEWALDNGYQDDLTIDRVKNDLGYSPDNCRWVDRIAQSNNTKSNVHVEINGEKHTLSEWGRISGLGVSRIHWRLRHGWQGTDLLKPTNSHKKIKKGG